MQSDRYEILAPSGSPEQLVAAVNNGCDAVYLGLDCFNARMKAPNFNAENLGHWVDFCHFFGVKVYVTINTSIKNGEFDSAVDALMCAYLNNADGVIVTDLALLKFAATLPKPFDVVASTQLSVHDGYGARFVKNLGASTVVYARECSYSDVKDIVEQNLRVECFLHGALCVCQSGQCLFSSTVGGNSGNRGLCTQPCRKFYKANDGKYTAGGYLLSTADLCGLDTAEKLLNLGVSSFKIEGRNRRAEYAGVTSAVYSKLFAQNFEKSSEDYAMLAETYNRGNLPSCNYLLGRNDDIVYPAVQGHIGVFVGKIVGGKVQTNVTLSKGDGLKVFDGDKEVCGGLVTESGSGLVCVDFSDRVRDGMTVHRTTSVQLSKNILGNKRTLDVQLLFTAKADNLATLTLCCGEIVVTVQSQQVVEKARENPTSKQEICQQLQKIGDLCYTISDIVTDFDDIFMPKSQINAIRREGFEKLTQKIVATYNSRFGNRTAVKYTDISQKRTADKCLAVVCKSISEVQQADTDYIIFKPQIIDTDMRSVVKANCFLDLPPFADNNYIAELLQGTKWGVVCHNVGQVQMAREKGISYVAGSGLNIFNDQVAAVFDDAVTFFYSQELTLSEISRFENQSGLTFVDGEIVLMKLSHCPYKLNFGCDCNSCRASRLLVYTDELGNKFNIRRRKDSSCKFELINGKKMSVVSKLQQAGRYCVDFDSEIIAHYKNLNNGIIDGYAEKRPYTKGRLYNKIN